MDPERKAIWHYASKTLPSNAPSRILIKRIRNEDKDLCVDIHHADVYG